jgi:hypothetical protein
MPKNHGGIWKRHHITTTDTRNMHGTVRKGENLIVPLDKGNHAKSK